MIYPMVSPIPWGGGSSAYEMGGGAYIWRGDLTEGFLRYEFGGLIFGGGHTWRGLFSQFYGILSKKISHGNIYLDYNLRYIFMIP